MHLPTRDRPAGPRTLWQRVTDAMRAAYHLAPEATRLRLFDMRVRFRQRWIAPGISVAIDPDRTRCFQIDLGSIVGAIRLNLRGREPSGTLSPGTEADRFCEDLTRELLDLTNPDSGQRLVKRVRRTADLFSGPEAHRLPDLLVEWDLEVPLGSSVVGTGSGATMKAYSPRIGLIEEVNAYCRTGEHRIDGMFVACGPNIMPGRLDRVVSNIDLAPTFARILGCAMPSVDGAVIPELVRAPGASAAIR